MPSLNKQHQVLGKPLMILRLKGKKKKNRPLPSRDSKQSVEDEKVQKQNIMHHNKCWLDIARVPENGWVLKFL